MYILIDIYVCVCVYVCVRARAHERTFPFLILFSSVRIYILDEVKHYDQWHVTRITIIVS